MKSKKALSQVVSVVVLIALVVAFVAGIWAIVDNFVNNELEDAKSCYDLFEKIRVNEDYTCYDSGSNLVQLSIDIGDLEIQSLLISVSQGTSSKVFELTNNSAEIEGVTNYPSGSSGVLMPGKESGKTYYVSGISQDPEKISISPKVNGKQCEVIASISDLRPC